MAYKVRIETGRGKNRAITESIALPNKQSVSNYVKRSPLGNSNTEVKIKDLSDGRVIKGKKLRFRNPERW